MSEIDRAFDLYDDVVGERMRGRLLRAPFDRQDALEARVREVRGHLVALLQQGGGGPAAAASDGVTGAAPAPGAALETLRSRGGDDA